MPNTTYKKIAVVTVGSGGSATMSFTSIPQTYTDLVLVTSARNSVADSATLITINGSTSNFSGKQVETNIQNAISSNSLTRSWFLIGGSSFTANTFASTTMYIPNYTSSNYKIGLTENVTENGAVVADLSFQIGLWSDSSAISSITITPGSSGNFVQYSTASLYGIKNT